MLSPSQIEEYEQNSFLLLPGFFDDDMVNKIQQWSMELPLQEGVEVGFEKGAVTRCENFIHRHSGFEEVAGNQSRLAHICGELFGEDHAAYLVKEKLNYKPPGGAGFMPHLDHPSLAFYLPSQLDNFITVMVAIDDMTTANGCLRVHQGKWNSSNVVDCIPPDGDPEVGGRAGCISDVGLCHLKEFDDVVCKAGDIFCFNGYVPHRSSSNSTSKCRRAVFFTYNPHSHGDHRTQYYQQLNDIRNNWKEKLRAQMLADRENEARAFASIPFTRKIVETYVPPPYISDSSEDEDETEFAPLF
ncbi:ectoine dioxygenase [Acrasis kona]|uniref:Ectoine dioxygenase n=1 Tax=Acrasis kona TaxID=1008807 RepID=A0AAW2YNG0_9EUKA